MKRQLFTECNEYEPPNKKKRLNNHLDTRKPTKQIPYESKTNIDAKQYKMIFDSIQKSTLYKNSNIPDDIVGEMAEFSVGTWMECYSWRCHELISISGENIESKTSIQCLKCGTKQWHHICDIHQNSFIVPVAKALICVDCGARVCKSSFVTCVICGDVVCINCVSDNTMCVECISGGWNDPHNIFCL